MINYILYFRRLIQSVAKISNLFAFMARIISGDCCILLFLSYKPRIHLFLGLFFLILLSYLLLRLKCFSILFVITSIAATVEPRLTAIPLIRPLRYYGHFILAQKKAQSGIFLFNEPF